MASPLNDRWHRERARLRKRNARRQVRRLADWSEAMLRLRKESVNFKNFDEVRATGKMAALMPLVRSIRIERRRKELEEAQRKREETQKKREEEERKARRERDQRKQAIP